MSTPTISVVLPTYNRSKLLRRAIASVLGQSHRDLELIVVDDCSQEDIGAVVRSFQDPRAIHIRRETNGGPAGARNTGLEAARGEWIAFQDSDDEWLSDKLAYQFAALQREPGLMLHSCGMLRHGGPALYSFPPPPLQHPGVLPAEAARTTPVAFTQTWLTRTSVIRDAGGFDRRLRVWDDWDLFWRIAEAHKVTIDPRTLVISHITAGGVGADVSRRVHDLAIFTERYQDHASASFRARLHYLLARYRLLSDDHPGAKAAARESIDIDRGSLKSWVAVGLTALPPPATRWLVQKLWR